MGETLNTSKFIITVHSVKIARNVNTGNFLTNLDTEQCVLYLIIDATFKNISKESRMLLDGDVLIVSKDNDEALKYEVSEVIMQNGWGIFLEPMNPGLTKRTKIVYKIPNNLSNISVYYVPFSTPSKTFIKLGDY